MPFTFSHPAIVLPFCYLHKRWLSLTALVIGSMTPDFEYFIRMKVLSHYSHTCVGLFWFDLPLGLLLMLLYNSLVKDKLIGHLPSYLNKRFSGFKNSDRLHIKPTLFAIIISLFIGVASHLLWDSFTHPTGYFVEHTHLLQNRVFTGHFNNIRIYNILQHLSSLLGACIILYSIIKIPAGKLEITGNLVYYWTKATLVALLVLIIRIVVRKLNLYQYGDIIVTGISGILIGIIVASITTSSEQVA